MDNLLLRGSDFTDEEFTPSSDLKDMLLNDAKILVIGAGGLGCEILKNLALIGVRSIFLIDLDTIELSNLNRQFLFREKDISKYKAEVAAEFIKNKYPHIKVEWSNKKCQDYPISFYKDFHVIIGGLDNIEARRWLNKLVHECVEFDENGEIDLASIIPYIDGGTEGFRGNSRVIIPSKTSCFECTMSLNTNTGAFALCTIAETPRLPEHCIEYIYILKWKDHFTRPVDKDSIDDVNWIYEQALKRAESFGIQGVTYQLTLGVIKNVIPAIASTNAIIAASTVSEALKVLGGFSKVLTNSMMFMGHEGIYCLSTQYEKEPQCPVCCPQIFNIEVDKSKIFGDFRKEVIESHKFDNPTFSRGSDFIYVPSPEVLEHISRPNLELTFGQLVEKKLYSQYQKLRVTDSTIKTEIFYKIKILG